MNGKWTVIPDIEDIDRFLKLEEQYNTAFEYNDFCSPSVYEDKDETQRRIRFYKSLGRTNPDDTLHGVFYDIAMISTDSVIRNRSRQLMEMSIETAKRLSCKGVVFHTGRIAGLDTKEYNDSWIKGMTEYLADLGYRHRDIKIYMENTFEATPDPINGFMAGLKGTDNVKICFDYAHAALTKTPLTEWYEAFSSDIAHIHVNDNDLKIDLHQPPGEGKIDFGLFKQLIEQHDYKESILLEVTGYEKTLRSLEYITKL